VPKRPDADMPFLAHLEELRRVLFRVLAAVLVGGIAGWVLSQRALDWVIANTSGSAIFMRPEGAFLARVKVALVLGILFTLPFTFQQIWSFVGPGLLAREKRVVLPGAVASVILFYAGLAFSYFLMTPIAVKVLMGFGGAHLKAQTEIHYLLDLVFMMGLASGLVFQLPLFAAFLSWVGVLTPPFMRRTWRHAIVLIFVLAAVLTPADPISQLLLAAPLLLLYGASFLLCIAIDRNRRRTRAARDGVQETPA
jgi:sec-independent protein translocase protein TatC